MEKIQFNEEALRWTIEKYSSAVHNDPPPANCTMIDMSILIRDKPSLVRTTDQFQSYICKSVDSVVNNAAIETKIVVLYIDRFLGIKAEDPLNVRRFFGNEVNLDDDGDKNRCQQITEIGTDQELPTDWGMYISNTQRVVLEILPLIVNGLLDPGLFTPPIQKQIIFWGFPFECDTNMHDVARIKGVTCEYLRGTSILDRRKCIRDERLFQRVAVLQGIPPNIEFPTPYWLYDLWTWNDDINDRLCVPIHLFKRIRINTLILTEDTSVLGPLVAFSKDNRGPGSLFVRLSRPKSDYVRNKYIYIDIRKLQELINYDEQFFGLEIQNRIMAWLHLMAISGTPYSPCLLSGTPYQVMGTASFRDHILPAFRNNLDTVSHMTQLSLVLGQDEMAIREPAVDETAFLRLLMSIYILKSGDQGKKQFSWLFSESKISAKEITSFLDGPKEGEEIIQPPPDKENMVRYSRMVLWVLYYWLNGHRDPMIFKGKDDFSLLRCVPHGGHPFYGVKLDEEGRRLIHANSISERQMPVHPCYLRNYISIRGKKRKADTPVLFVDKEKRRAVYVVTHLLEL